MKKLVFILIIISLYLTSCKQCEPTYVYQRIRDTVHVIVPKVIVDSGKVQIVNDTLVQYVKENGKDTIIEVKYYPKYKTMLVYAKPDTIFYKDTDTLVTTEIREVIAESPFKDFMLYAMGIILLFCLVYFLYNNINKVK